jgi:hypothetical protein
LNRDRVVQCQVSESADDATVVVDPAVLVDQRRTLPERDRHLPGIDPRVVADRPVVDGDGQVEIGRRRQRACPDETDLFLHGRRNRQVVRKRVSIDVFEQVCHQRKGHAIVDGLTEEAVAEPPRRRIPDHARTDVDPERLGLRAGRCADVDEKVVGPETSRFLGSGG